MGTPPDHDITETADDCPSCAGIIFPGHMPRFMEAHVWGIKACPGVPLIEPNGIYLLEQQLDPCVYTFIQDPIVINYFTNPVSSTLIIEQLGGSWFNGFVPFRCQFSFAVNFNVCGQPFTFGKDGHVRLWWDPGDPPWEF